MHLRASQINGCSVCVDIHSRELELAGESSERIHTVAAWRETPYFSEAERAALALTEAATRLADRPEPVSDEVWDEAARHYSEEQLAALVVAIATINAFNRLNAATRQMTGGWVEQLVAGAAQAAEARPRCRRRRARAVTDREQLLDDLRPVAFAIAYRMLGSVSEAEDIVQEALLRVHQALEDGEEIESPPAFTATVTTRLAINELRSARVRRESYVGEWLPGADHHRRRG